MPSEATDNILIAATVVVGGDGREDMEENLEKEFDSLQKDSINHTISTTDDEDAQVSLIGPGVLHAPPVADMRIVPFSSSVTFLGPVWFLTHSVPN